MKILELTITVTINDDLTDDELEQMADDMELISADITTFARIRITDKFNDSVTTRIA